MKRYLSVLGMILVSFTWNVLTAAPVPLADEAKTIDDMGCLLTAPEHLTRGGDGGQIGYSKKIFDLKKAVAEDADLKALLVRALSETLMRRLNESPWSALQPREMTPWERLRIDVACVMLDIAPAEAKEPILAFYKSSPSPVVWRNLEAIYPAFGLGDLRAQLPQDEQARRNVVAAEAEKPMLHALDGFKERLKIEFDDESRGGGNRFNSEVNLRHDIVMGGISESFLKQEDADILIGLLCREFLRQEVPKSLRGTYGFLDPLDVYKEMLLDALNNVRVGNISTRALDNLGKDLANDNLRIRVRLIRERALIWEGRENAVLTTRQNDNPPTSDLQRQEELWAKVLKSVASKSGDAGEAFLAENKKKEGVHVTESGLQYKVIKEGDGTRPKATDVVLVHYEGRTIDGTIFDSSIERGNPVQFPVRAVIAGWTEALQMMKVGAKWTLYIPANLAYGKRGVPPKIGPNEVLIFDVELLNID